jgi:hypothetical protein
MGYTLGLPRHDIRLLMGFRSSQKFPAPMKLGGESFFVIQN